jgi:hypothetical protein
MVFQRWRLTMLKHNFHIFKSWLFLGVISFWITACNVSNPSNDHYVMAKTPTSYAIVHESAVVYTTIEEISNNSKIIIIGRPVANEGIVNTARDPDDPTKEDPEYFGIGQVYEVEISSYIKGEGPNSLYVIQNQGIINRDLHEISDDDIEQAQKVSKVIPLLINEQYILFLHPASYSYGKFPLEQLVVGRGHPWAFRINELGCAQAEDSIANVLRYFPARPLDEFVGYIQNPNSYRENNPYPYPESEAKCVINSPEKPYP